MSNSDTPPQSPPSDPDNGMQFNDDQHPQDANQRQDFRAALRRMLTGMSGALSYLNPSYQPSRAGQANANPSVGPQMPAPEQEPQPAPEAASPGLFDRASAEELISGLFPGVGSRIDDTGPFAARSSGRPDSDANGPGEASGPGEAGAPPQGVPPSLPRPFGVISVYITTSENVNRSASEAAIASLKAVPLSELPLDVEACPICYETYEDPKEPASQAEPQTEPGSDAEQPGPGPQTQPEQGHDHSPLAMPCGHIFGKACLRTWLDSESSCPMCRLRLEQAGRGPPTNSPFASTEFFLLSVIADANAHERIIVQRQDQQRQEEQQHGEQNQDEGITFDWNPIAPHFAQLLRRTTALFEPAGRAQSDNTNTTNNEPYPRPDNLPPIREGGFPNLFTMMNERAVRASQASRLQRQQMREELRRQREQVPGQVPEQAPEPASSSGSTPAEQPARNLMEALDRAAHERIMAAMANSSAAQRPPMAPTAPEPEQSDEPSDSDMEPYDEATTDSSTASFSSHSSRRRGPNSRFASHQRSHPYTR